MVFSIGGIKTTKALSWSIPVVNHVWLEDCFAQWMYLSPALSKYIDFPPHVDFTPMLAERKLAQFIEDASTEEEEDARREPIGTEGSAREVEGILSAEDMEVSPKAPVRSKVPTETRMVSQSVNPTKSRGAGPSKPESTRLFVVSFFFAWLFLTMVAVLVGLLLCVFARWERRGKHRKQRKAVLRTLLDYSITRLLGDV